jgi:siderophore synthetase component
MKITYDFENLVSPLLEAAAAKASRPFDVEDDRLILPVHELQIYHIQEKVGTAIIYPEEFSLPLLAQQSLR